ncbi:fimbrial protein [Archangium violaceum]|nr:fimbrial protein [Archangium violaceum]
MKTMKCPKCGNVLDVTGRVPGSNITCACGNMSAVPGSGMSRKALFIILGISGLVLLCPCVGVLSAIAIPNFIRFQARSKQAECRANLKAWYTTQRAYFQQKDAYSASIEEVGFSPERGNRYAYFAGPGPLEERGTPQVVRTAAVQGIGVDTVKYAGAKPISLEQLPEGLGSMVGVQGECPDCNITLVCAGQVDRDDTLDVWSISTEERMLEDGTPIPGGVPFNHVNDVED